MYEAYARGDLDSAIAQCHSDIEWIPPKLSPTAGIYRGHGEGLQELREWTEPFEDYRWEPEQFVDAGDQVVVVGRSIGRGRGSGAPVDQEEIHVWTLRDGTAVRMEMYYDRGEAAAGLGTAKADS